MPIGNLAKVNTGLSEGLGPHPKVPLGLFNCELARKL